MKKYFVKGTGEKLEFGDSIELNFHKELKNGEVERNMECVFSPEMADLLLELDIIEEGDDHEPIDFGEDAFEVLISTLCERVTVLEKEVEGIKNSMKAKKVQVKK